MSALLAPCECCIKLEEENAKLRKYILELKPYCDNCRGEKENDEDEYGCNCEECHKKSFRWRHTDIIVLE